MSNNAGKHPLNLSQLVSDNNPHFNLIAFLASQMKLNTSASEGSNVTLKKENERLRGLSISMFKALLIFMTDAKENFERVEENFQQINTALDKESAAWIKLVSCILKMIEEKLIEGEYEKGSPEFLQNTLMFNLLIEIMNLISEPNADIQGLPEELLFSENVRTFNFANGVRGEANDDILELPEVGAA